MKKLKVSSRSQRLNQFKKLHKGSGLNLVSLMDIFTILVFFLLVSSSSVHQLPNTRDLKLPSTVAEKAPKETPVIMVTRDSLLVQGHKVADIAEVLAADELVIPALEKELKFQASKVLLSPEAEKAGRAITIMADETMPYELLRKVLATCRQANYLSIAFSANRKAKGKA